MVPTPCMQYMVYTARLVILMFKIPNSWNSYACYKNSNGSQWNMLAWPWGHRMARLEGQDEVARCVTAAVRVQQLLL